MVKSIFNVFFYRDVVERCFFYIVFRYIIIKDKCFVSIIGFGRYDINCDGSVDVEYVVCYSNSGVIFFFCVYYGYFIERIYLEFGIFVFICDIVV